MINGVGKKNKVLFLFLVFVKRPFQTMKLNHLVSTSGRVRSYSPKRLETTGLIFNIALHFLTHLYVCVLKKI